MPPAPTLQPLAATSRVSPARLERAAEAGRQARNKLHDYFYVLPPTPTLDIRNRYYVVLRGLQESNNGLYFSFREYKEAVVLPRSRSMKALQPAYHTVSHAFPTVGEAKAYIKAAGQAGQSWFHPLFDYQ